MSVSLRPGISNFFSEKYDKKNIYILMGLSLIPIISGIISEFEIPGLSGAALTIWFLSSIIFGLLLVGFMACASYNGIRQRKKIIPNIIDDFGTLLWVGLKWFIGYLLIIILITIPLWLLFFLTIYLSSIGAIALVILFAILGGIYFLFIILYSISLNLMFLRTLKFKDFFNFPAAALFIKKKKRDIFSYFAKVGILLSFLINIITVLITLVISIFLFLINIPQDTIKNIITIIDVYIYYLIYYLLLIDFNIQIAKLKLKKPKESKCQ